MCDSAGRLYIAVDDGGMQPYPRDGRKISSSKQIGHVNYRLPGRVCANYEFFLVIPTMQTIADRRPYDGQNFVMLMGVWLDKYTNLWIKIGEAPVPILLRINSSILVNCDTLPQAKKETTMGVGRCPHLTR
jgi:hypothetical protein